jgi:hypothetical protein
MWLLSFWWPRKFKSYALRSAQRKEKGMRRMHTRKTSKDREKKINRSDASPFLTCGRRDLNPCWAYFSCDIHGKCFCRLGSRQKKREVWQGAVESVFLWAPEYAGSSTECLASIKNIPASLYAQAHLRSVFFALPLCFFALCAIHRLGKFNFWRQSPA